MEAFLHSGDNHFINNTGEMDIELDNNTILGEINNFTDNFQKQSFSVTTSNCKVYRFIMSVGITGSLCCFGIMGNILTLLVFSKFNQTSSDKKSRSSASLLLSGLAVSDTSLLFILFIVKSTPSFISFTKIYPKFFTTYFFAFLMVYGWNTVDVAQCINTWVTVLVAMHRFIAIIAPHKAMIHCTFKKAKIHLIVVSIIVIIYEIPIFLDNNNETIYFPAYKNLNLNHHYQLIYKTTLLLYHYVYNSLDIIGNNDNIFS